MLILIFDGTNPHSGFAPICDRQSFVDWVNSNVEPLWKIHKTQNRQGLVVYPNMAAHHRYAGMSMTRNQQFGNFRAAEAHVQAERNYATHGEEILGGKEAWANRMGREVVSLIWNHLQECDLDLDTDLNDLIQSIHWKDETGERHPLHPLPINPQHDQEHINKWRGHYEYYKLQCASIRISLEKAQFRKHLNKIKSKKDMDSRTAAFPLLEHCSFESLPRKPLQGSSEPPDGPVEIEEVLCRRSVDGQVSEHSDILRPLILTSLGLLRRQTCWKW